MDIEEIGRQINRRRVVLGLSIRDLADLTGKSKTTILNIERGAGNPTFQVLQDIFEYLNLEISLEVKAHNQ